MTDSLLLIEMGPVGREGGPEVHENTQNYPRNSATPEGQEEPSS